MLMLALLPECGIMLAKRVKALKALCRASTAPDVQRPLTLLCVWDGGVFEGIEELCVWGVFSTAVSQVSWKTYWATQAEVVTYLSSVRGMHVARSQHGLNLWFWSLECRRSPGSCTADTNTLSQLQLLPPPPHTLSLLWRNQPQAVNQQWILTQPAQ